MTSIEFRSLLRADFQRTPWFLERTVLFTVRLGQFTRGARWRRVPAHVLYKLLDGIYLRVLIGVEWPASVTCGPGVLLHHAGRGVVIHPGSVIGARLNLYHGVTIGQAGEGRPPVLGDDVYLGTGSSVLGPVTVGHGAKVGAGAVVVHDVPEGATYVGVPARRVR